jgi:hypothetical protein
VGGREKSSGPLEIGKKFIKIKLEKKMKLIKQQNM